MFTYIKLKNFMSFKDVTFDFRGKRNNAKKFISIYGENGSGKSNFVNSINLLVHSINSFEMISHAKKFYEEVQTGKLSSKIFQMILDETNILNIAHSCRMVDCNEETQIEYGFQYKDHNGYYTLSFSDKFVYEKLYYFTGKQRGTLFEISQENENIKIDFSNKLFQTKKAESEMRDELVKYWGKHTFLSILNRERREKNEQYVRNNYLVYVFDILDMLQEINIHHKKTPFSGSEIQSGKPNNVLRTLDIGKIRKNQENILDRSERILNDFFTQAYADLKELFYEKKYEGNSISYKLYVKKMIGGQIRTIGFDRESSGTRHILDIIRSLLGVFCGVTVIYDEIDDGIHDLLLKNILTSMLDDITGQLIITTHNSYLLETIDIKSVYLINVDYQGNKSVKCLDKYPRIQGSNNPRIMYLKGLFGGVPVVDNVDYDIILHELKDPTTDVKKGE